MTASSIIKLGKIDAAHRQLRTAISLWFTDGDPVAVHALAFAAYEVLHTVSKKRNKYRRDLLFDSDLIKDEYRSQWNIRLKKEAYFFKHADRDPEAEIEFNPEASFAFIMFSVLARELCGASQSAEESAWIWWTQIHNPDLLTEKGRKALSEQLPTQTLDYVRGLSKSDFYEGWRDARSLLDGLQTMRDHPTYLLDVPGL